MDSDLVVMVTEPTPFGLYDLELAHAAFKTLSLPMAVVINRAGRGDFGVDRFCRRVDLPVVGRLPFDRRIAEAYAQGRIPVDAIPELKAVFAEMLTALQSLALRPEEVDHA
jgi:MinD superfamily P-loop ATPase